MTTDTQGKYNIPEKLQLLGKTYPVINWNDIRYRGLLYKANATIFNPAGLMVFVDVESGVSPGAMEGNFTLSAAEVEAAVLGEPAGDVAGLVSALEDIGSTWHRSSSQLEAYMRNVARDALATYRNQGGAQ